MTEQNINSPKTDNNVATPESAEPTVQKNIIEVINEIDPGKVRLIMDAIVAPFHKESRQSRRDILFVFGGMLFLLIALLTIMAFMDVMDTSAVIFFYGTAFGYLMGFLTKFFIKD
jgi:hypothetical protein